MKMVKFLSKTFIALSLIMAVVSCENTNEESDNGSNDNNTSIATDIVSELSSGLTNQEPEQDETNKTITQPIVGESNYVSGNMIYKFTDSNILESVSCEMTIDCKSAVIAILVEEMLLKNSSFTEKFPAENIQIEGSSIKLSYTQTNDLIDTEIKGMTMDEIMAFCNNNANIADQNLVNQILENVQTNMGKYAEPIKGENVITQLFGNSDNVVGEYTYNFNSENILESVTGALNIDCKYAAVAESVLTFLKDSEDISSSIKDNLQIEGSNIKATFTQTNDLITDEIKGMTIDELMTYCQGLLN